MKNPETDSSEQVDSNSSKEDIDENICEDDDDCNHIDNTICQKSNEESFQTSLQNTINELGSDTMYQPL